MSLSPDLLLGCALGSYGRTIDRLCDLREGCNLLRTNFIRNENKLYRDCPKLKDEIQKLVEIVFEKDQVDVRMVEARSRGGGAGERG
jgi:hypothetical protein